MSDFDNFNPATGLPMTPGNPYGTDVAGNPYGVDNNVYHNPWVS
ncbi:MAG: hypothetical protein QMB55_11960 [Propionivibrio sp.]